MIPICRAGGNSVFLFTPKQLICTILPTMKVILIFVILLIMLSCSGEQPENTAVENNPIPDTEPSHSNSHPETSWSAPTREVMINLFLTLKVPEKAVQTKQELLAQAKLAGENAQEVAYTQHLLYISKFQIDQNQITLLEHTRDILVSIVTQKPDTVLPLLLSEIRPGTNHPVTLPLVLTTLVQLKKQSVSVPVFRALTSVLQCSKGKLFPYVDIQIEEECRSLAERAFIEIAATDSSIVFSYFLTEIHAGSLTETIGTDLFTSIPMSSDIVLPLLTTWLSTHTPNNTHAIETFLNKVLQHLSGDTFHAKTELANALSQTTRDTWKEVFPLANH